MGVRIIGTGKAVPKKVLTNEMMSEILDTSDEWIYSRTGIKQRYISTGETNTKLCVDAAKDALKDSGLKGEDIDLIVVATITSDKLTPSTACLVQAEIGAKNSMAFDIVAACSGFVYALDIAVKFIKSNEYKNVLIIGGEVLSKILDWSDRKNAVLFGDGAGAAIVTNDERDYITSINCVSVGEKAHTLTCNSLEIKNLYKKHNDDFSNYLSMDGKEIFKFAIDVIEKSIEKILEDENLSFKDIDYIIPHQANSRMIDTIAKKKNYDRNKFYMNIERYGNTSSASIPIALDEMNKKNLLKDGMKIILIGFGGGLTYGSALVNWKK